MQKNSLMPSKWTDNSLDDPAPNLPCKPPFEALVQKIGWELRPASDRKCSQQEIARMLCSDFNLKPPITGEKIRTFFEMAGIHHDVAPCSGETTFIPNRSMRRWEIYTRPCATFEWSREVWHEVWEILFWRCYHCIPWWKDWAARNGCYRPHAKADEFAYQVLLSPQSVSAQSRKRYYDLYEVANYYSVPTNLAFRALQSYSRFEFPLLFMVLRMDTKPPDQAQISLQGDLFGHTDDRANIVHATVWHTAYKKGLLPQVHELFSAEETENRRALELNFQTLARHCRKGVSLCTEANDPLYRYCKQTEPKSWSVSHVFGLDLTAEVTVITRQSPRCDNEIFLQIMPAGQEASFLENTNKLLTPEELLQGWVNKEWRQAADSLAKGVAKRVAVPGC